MGKKISFGKYNQLYKHIWYYIITKLIREYFLDSFFVEKVELLKGMFPKSVLIQSAFNYLGEFIGSIFLLIYEENSGQKQIDLNENKNLYKSFWIVVILLFLCILTFKLFFVLQIKGLYFWMFEILFIAIISFKLFGTPIYRHRKLGIIINLLSGLFTILSTIYRFIDDDNKKIYTKYLWIIPIGIIFSILITLLRAYTFCKIKYLFNKLILPSQILIFSSFLGAALSFIASIISSIYPCTNHYYDLKDDSFMDYFIKSICKIREKNSSVLYFDSYSVYFKELFKNNILLIILFIFKIGIFTCNKIFYIYIIKNLSPEFIICANSLSHILFELFDFLFFIFKNTEFKFYKFYSMIAQIFCFIGSIIYLELIELHFCKLDYDLRENIGFRGDDDFIGKLKVDDDYIGKLIDESTIEDFENENNENIEIPLNKKQ